MSKCLNCLISIAKGKELCVKCFREETPARLQRTQSEEKTMYCGKKRYENKKHAQTIMNFSKKQRRKTLPQRAYFCETCGYWHLTSKPDWFAKPQIQRKKRKTVQI